MIIPFLARKSVGQKRRTDTGTQFSSCSIMVIQVRKCKKQKREEGVRYPMWLGESNGWKYNVAVTGLRLYVCMVGCEGKGVWERKVLIVYALGRSPVVVKAREARWWMYNEEDRRRERCGIQRV